MSQFFSMILTAGYKFQAVNGNETEHGHSKPGPEACPSGCLSVAEAVVVATVALTGVGLVADVEATPIKVF